MPWSAPSSGRVPTIAPRRAAAPEEPEDTGQVVQGEARIPPAGAACVVDHFGARFVNDRGTAQAQAMADIDVLVIEEIGLVEAVYRPVSVGAKQHEHAGDPVHLRR